MPFPSNGTAVPGTGATYGTQTIQTVIDIFNRRNGAARYQNGPNKGQTVFVRNHSIHIGWMAFASKVAQSNSDLVSTLETPASSTRPKVVLLGDFSKSSHRAKAELIAKFLTSADPTVAAILQPFKSSTVAQIVGENHNVPAQEIYIALSSLKYGTSGGTGQAAGDLYSPNDAEFEVVLNADWPINSDFYKAQFLYFLVHELDHKV